MGRGSQRELPHTRGAQCDILTGHQLVGCERETQFSCSEHPVPDGTDSPPFSVRREGGEKAGGFRVEQQRVIVKGRRARALIVCSISESGPRVLNIMQFCALGSTCSSRSRAHCPRHSAP